MSSVETEKTPENPLNTADSTHGTDSSETKSAASQQSGKADNERKDDGIEYLPYTSEEQLYPLAELIAKGLSEPYSLFTYRYFLNNWPDLSFVAKDKETGKIIGGVIAKLEVDNKDQKTKVYIGMLIVDETYRGRNIGSTLVRLVMRAALHRGVDMITIETEVTNTAALNLYQRLGFVRSKKMIKYYLNGNDAYLLKFWLKPA